MNARGLILGGTSLAGADARRIWKATRAWLPALALVLFAGGGLAACDDGDPTAGDFFSELDADKVMVGVTHYIHDDRGTVRALLVADTSYFYDEANRIDVRQVHLTMYDELGRPTGELTSLTGELNTRTEVMVARGEVVLVTTGGERVIETEELHFDPNGDRVWSDVPTRLTEDGTVLRGSGFTSDAQLRNLRVRDPEGERLRIPL